MHSHPSRHAHRIRRSAPLAATLVFLSLTTLVPCALGRTAYVTNEVSNTVSLIDTATDRRVGGPIGVGKVPVAVAITPDGKAAYVADEMDGTVSVIDTATNLRVTTIGGFNSPNALAITPDGRSAYVVNEGFDSVSVIDTGTNQKVEPAIPVGDDPFGIAITPDGRTAYVTNTSADTVSVIDTATNQKIEPAIAVGDGPYGIAITPDGKAVYVANEGSDNVSVIDAATKNLKVGSPIGVGDAPVAVAISPDGKTAYVTNKKSNTVSMIDTATSQKVGQAIDVLTGPVGIAITPDGRKAYVAARNAASVSMIDIATSQAAASVFEVGTTPYAVAIVPDQPPTAAFSAPRARPGVPVTFNAAASSDSDGTIASYAWSFGDGQSATSSVPTQAHTFNAPRTYLVSLVLTDNEGCSGSLLFTGQTAFCNASALTSKTQPLEVAFPGVRVKCPKTAKPKGCVFKLQAIGRKPRKGKKAKVQSAVTKVKVKPGRKAITSIKPRAAFRAKLAVATKVLVRKTVTIAGSSKTGFARLRVVR